MLQTAQKARKISKVRYGQRERYKYDTLNVPIEMPYLISIQRDSYRKFLEKGIGEVIKEFSPITDFSGKAELTFVSYRLDPKIKYDKFEAKRRGVSYTQALQVLCRLVNKETGAIIEKEVYLGDIPLMTEEGCFVINGVEKVIVSQIVRSPSVYYESSIDKTGNNLFHFQMRPSRGTLIEGEKTPTNTLKAILDRSCKVSLGVFLKGLIWSSDEQKAYEKKMKVEHGSEEARKIFNDYIIDLFGNNELIKNTLEKEINFDTPDECLLELSKKLRPTELPSTEAIKSYMNAIFFGEQRYDLADVGRYKFNNKLSLANRIIKQKLYEPITLEDRVIAKGTELDRDTAWEIQNAGINEVWLDIKGKPHKVIGNNTVELDKVFRCDPKEFGINELVHYPTLQNLLKQYKTKQEKIDAIKENVNILVPHTLTIDDIFASISFMLDLDQGIGTLDNIDHLANRRVCTVGELMGIALRAGFMKLVNLAKESMQGQDLTTADPTSIINARVVNKALRDFVSSSQLSQLMDQINPISELAQKRRLSAVGPGGIKKERAGAEARDIHYTHYSRICSIETPEGQSIGLINSLALYAKVNEYGFIQAPYRKIDKATGKITDQVDYMMADEEEKYIICQAAEPLDEEGRLLNDRVVCRFKDRIIEVDKSRVDYMDVSPRQFMSAATTLIPFLENDDATRALMGSNMQRQAVPLIRTEAPIVATGMEEKIARDSGAMVLSEFDGEITYVSSDRVTVKGENEEKTYKLIKFSKTNHDTCINQKPCVKKGDKVKKGEVIADGFSTNGGELALGKNMLVAFMNWEGYNYEDAILISERLVKEDIFTSITLRVDETKARATKLGDEIITREIPNISEEALKNLDERGIVRVGTEVRAGDILVGKITPKGETELTPEERLLRAIFGEKAREVRDTSLRVLHGHDGVVVDVQVFSRKNKDELEAGVNELVKVTIAQKRKLRVGDKMAGRHGNKGVVSRVLPVEDMPFMANGQPVDIVLNTLGVPSRMNLGQILEVHLGMVAKALNINVATPVFNGFREHEIQNMLIENQLPADGKFQLYDGRTGQPFENRATVGYMYMIKLDHMVDSKMHARSTGPYALVTQQPLGGKAMFGGQRFGEMEVWAIEAYGAANILQELLTVKSDDVVGRNKTYEAIVTGEPIAEPGIPEAFKVLIKEFQSLGLDLRILNEDKKEISLAELSGDDDEIMQPVKNREQVTEIELNFDNGEKVEEEDEEIPLSNEELEASLFDDDAFDDE